MSKNPVIFLVISLASLPMIQFLSRLYGIDGKVILLGIFSFLALFIYASRKLISDFIIESIYFKIVFYIYLIYELSILIRGLSLSQENIITYLTSSIVLWPLIIPLFAFFKKDLTYFIILLKWIFYLGILFLLLILINPSLLLQRQTAESVIGLASSCGYILLFSSFINKRKVNISFLIIFIALLSLTFLARRSGMITLLGFIIASYLLSLNSNSKALLFRIIPLVAVFGMLILSGFNNVTSVIVEKLDERMTEDTRSELFEFFFYDMEDYMIFGKGMNGTYYCPVGGGIEEEGIVFAEIEHREVIENGYLQLLLTGGIVHVTLFFLVLFPAAILGILKSKNLFSKACGSIILLWLIDMVAFGLPSLSMNYIFVWICVGMSYMASLRGKTDEEIRIEFQKNNFA